MKLHSKVLSLSFLVFLFMMAFFFILGLDNRGRVSSFQEGTFKVNSDKKSFFMIHAGKERTGKLFIPSSYDGKKSFSLVLCMHGAGSNGNDFQAVGFNRIADRYNFIMLYPDSLGRSWHVTPGVKTLSDDLGFIKRLIAEMQKKYSIDPERIYVTGHSMGAFMTYRLAYELSETISAVAPVSGLAVVTYNSPVKKPQGKVSVLHQHALNDSVVNMNGDMLNSTFSMSKSLKLWVDINSIAESPVLDEEQSGTKITTWTDKHNGIEVTGCLYIEGGHDWPIEATERITSFFYNHPPRKNQLKISCSKESGLISQDDPLTIIPHFETLMGVNEVKLYANNKEIAVTKKAPFHIQFFPQMNNRYELYLRAQLTDGTVIVSGNSLTYTFSKPNIAKNVRVKTSGNENDSLTGKNAVDGNIHSRWSSEWNDDQYIQMDLGSKKRISGVTLLWENASANAYSIQVSNDAKKWKRVYREKNGKGGEEFISLDPVDARYIKMQGKKRNTKWGYSLYEIMVHGR